ncbi:S1 domain-containing RNA-binding protein [Lutispora saccharofermentans]|uniref:RNA-binding protein S1 n=1 Tax=Lutispora saccharofermentans TaxID=3024236 RepID=A0ABT1NH32_9FIRM|nr:S1 domain-containing RNA-binding protein [Lutispora saccharofermentans]MCQ1530588.1 RNA-binding protein S1 [Lutispora saccharofermentans]
MPIEEGMIVDGIVANITKFGAFVQLSGGKTGLVHISEIADTYIKDINSYLKEKQAVRVKVLNIDRDGKINLSIKQAQTIKKSTKPAEIDWQQEFKKNQSGSFEDRLSKFMKESEERLQEFMKNRESKRSGGYSRKGDIAQR